MTQAQLPFEIPREVSRPAGESADYAHRDFYHLYDAKLEGRCCAGLACFAARHDAPERWREAGVAPQIHCLGHCYQAPAQQGRDGSPQVSVRSRECVLLNNVRAGGVNRLKPYEKGGGFTALKKAQSLPAGKILDEVRASQLRGRGGAGFPAWRKWQAVANEHPPVKYLVANADEGDAGAYSDRLLLEDDPFLLIEGMAIAAHAVGARHGLIYLRREYPAAAVALRSALSEARSAGWLGSHFNITLSIGHGSYICGEETAMLNALEHRRPEVRLRPPQITQHGLHGAPTLVHNIETLCAVPWILQHGGAAYAELGFSKSRGSKLLSLNSLFRKPGLYEVEFGISLRQIVEDLGGGLRRGNLLGLMVGGPLAGLVPPRLLDTALGYEEMQSIDAAVGHGGVIAFSDDTSIAEIIEQVFRFGANESCGKCTPCSLGTPRVASMFSDVLSGTPANSRRYYELIEALAQTSLCGHGRGLAEFAHSIARHYPKELSACLS